MKIEIIKEGLREYKAGDILSVGSPHELRTYLLFENTEDEYIGLIDLYDGKVFKEYIRNEYTYSELIDEAVKLAEGHEWKVFSSDGTTLTLGKK